MDEQSAMKSKLGIIVSAMMMAIVVASCDRAVSSKKETSASTGFVFDSFTAPDETPLESHTGEKGAKWNKCGVENIDEVLISSNRIHKDGGNHDAIYYASGIPASAEYDVSADLYVASNVHMLFSAICGRMDDDAKTMYLVWYSHTNTSWELNKFDSGTQTHLGRYVLEATPGKTYKVKLEIRNSAKKVFIDGIEHISSTDNSITEPGRAGVYFTSQDPLGAQAANVGYHIDNLVAVDANLGTTVSWLGRAMDWRGSRGLATYGDPSP